MGVVCGNECACEGNDIRNSMEGAFGLSIHDLAKCSQQLYTVMDSIIVGQGWCQHWLHWAAAVSLTGWS